MNVHPSTDQLLLDKLYEAMENNLQNEQFGVTELADAVGLGKSQLNRKLQLLTSKSASQFIREYRLKKALELLRSKAATPSEVSYMVGFGSPSYFSTCFKEYYGYSPNEVKYRENGIDNNTGVRWKKITVLSLGVILILALSYLSFNTFVVKDQAKIKIAVLPMKGQNRDSTYNHLPYFITEDISHRLSKILEIEIIGTSFVENMDVQSIMNNLNADFLLETSFFIMNDSAQLYFKLSDPKDGSIIWSEPYERKLTNVMDFLGEVAFTIADQLDVNISPPEENQVNKKPTQSNRAYSFYLRGSDFLSRYQSEENLRFASEFFEKAIALDSSFAKAWIGLTAANKIIYARDYDRSAEQAKKVTSYRKIAESLDPNNLSLRLHNINQLSYSQRLQSLNTLLDKYPMSDTILGKISHVYRNMGQYEAALEYMEKAIELSPANYGYLISAGILNNGLRRYQEGLEYYLTAKEMLTNHSLPQIAQIYLLMGEVEKAQEYLRNNQHQSRGKRFDIRTKVERVARNYERALAIMSEADTISTRYHSSFRTKSLELGLIYFCMSDRESAKEQFLQTIEFLEQKLEQWPDDPRILASLGTAYAGTGSCKKAVQAARRSIEIIKLQNSKDQLSTREKDLALVYVMCGQNEKAVQQLEHVMKDAGVVSIRLLKVDPFWDPLRDLESFKALINNPEYQVNQESI